MGGVFSCVADLARWVSGFTGAFPPGEPGTGGAHPLPRATRREMQLPQVTLAPPPLARLPGDPAEGGPAGYGFGLFVEEHPVRGRIASHSGGYPGFGSHMRWHPETGIGVIVLANSTYAAASTLEAALRQAPPAPAAGGPATAGYVTSPATPWPETLAAQQEVNRLLHTWNDARADRLFSENVAQDEPYRERRRKIDVIVKRIGGFGEDKKRQPEFDSPAHCRWWLRGEDGVIQAGLRLTPGRPPRVQSLTLAVRPPPDAPLARVLDSLGSLLNSGADDWPRSLPVSGDVDTGLLLRQFRMAGAWAGRCRQGVFRAGNGETSTTVELEGERARLVLAVVAGGAGQLRLAEIMLSP